MALFILVTVLFFLWGMSNNLTDILVQQFKKSFELSTFSAQLVSTANFTGYFCMAIPAALVMRKWGYKVGHGDGAVPVRCRDGAVLASRGERAISSVPGGLVRGRMRRVDPGDGSESLYGAVWAGTHQRAEIELCPGVQSSGTILGVWVGREFILSGIEKTPTEVESMKAAGTYVPYLHGEIMRVVPTYIALGTAVLLFALVLSRMHFPKILSEHEGDTADMGASGLCCTIRSCVCGGGECLQCGRANLHVSNLIFYMKQYTRVSEKTAANYIIYSLVAMLLGRFITTPLMKHIAPSRLLGIYGVANVVMMGLAVVRPGMIGAWASLRQASSCRSCPDDLCAGTEGPWRETPSWGARSCNGDRRGAFFPLVLGAIARSTGEMRYGYLVPMVCFAAWDSMASSHRSCCRSREIPIRRQDCWLRRYGQGF